MGIVLENEKMFANDSVQKKRMMGEHLGWFREMIKRKYFQNERKKCANHHEMIFLLNERICFVKNYRFLQNKRFSNKLLKFIFFEETNFSNKVLKKISFYFTERKDFIEQTI